MSPALTPKQARFCEEYLVDLNGSAAAIRAGYSARSARKIATELLDKPHLQARITELQQARSKRTEITADAVLQRLWTIATADPRELIEYRRTACRYCHGRDFRYHSTKNELARARSLWEATQKKNSPEVFDEQGGDGYNATRSPHPHCPECFGEGVERVFVADTRTLSPAAIALYAGVKTTKDGLEVKMQSQEVALIHVGKHLGMFGDRVEEPESAEEKARRIRAAMRAMDDATGAAA